MLSGDLPVHAGGGQTGHGDGEGHVLGELGHLAAAVTAHHEAAHLAPVARVDKHGEDVLMTHGTLATHQDLSHHSALQSLLQQRC